MISEKRHCENMNTLRVSTRDKVLKGITSMDEFKRIAYSTKMRSRELKRRIN